MLIKELMSFFSSAFCCSFAVVLLRDIKCAVVFGGVGGKLTAVVLLIGVFDIAQVIVALQMGVTCFDDRYGYIGAMVGNTFKVVYAVVVHKSQLKRAGALLNALDVAGLELFGQCVDYLLQRLHLLCRIGGVAQKCAARQIEYFMDGVGADLEFTSCSRGEVQLLVLQLFCQFGYIYGVVGDTFDIAQTYKLLCRCLIFLFRQLACVKLH